MNVRARLAAALLLIVMWPLVARADTWQLDPAHSTVEFTVTHLMISKVKGMFQKTTGTIVMDGDNPATAKVDVVIDASSIDTHVDKRDKHLKSADFLDVAKYPNITFKSTKLEPAGTGKWKLSGDLTIHGVTKPVVLDVEGPSQQIKDPMGHTRMAASATTKINRKDFGLTWNRALETGGVVVGDELAISIEVEAVKTKP